jgi:hypothetical protein
LSRAPQYAGDQNWSAGTSLSEVASHIRFASQWWVTNKLLGLFTRVSGSRPFPAADGHPAGPAPLVDISIRLREMWR